ncbi:hypothetical protein [Actinoplanes sp. NPDC051851]|uniref:DUF7674 family protein n=1 Tax=Actinoplanes sp. NPDC051851 TaxID=3154753 RepID=UPI00344AA006
MSDSSQAFVRRLVTDFPGLRPLYDEHIADNDELLDHMFFYVVTQWVVEGFQAGRDQEWLRLLDYLDAGLREGDADVQELIGVSFVENLPLPNEPGADIAGHLPTELRAELGRQRPFQIPR